MYAKILSSLGLTLEGQWSLIDRCNIWVLSNHNKIEWPIELSIWPIIGHLYRLLYAYSLSELCNFGMVFSSSLLCTIHFV